VSRPRTLWSRPITPELAELLNRPDLCRGPDGRMRPIRLLPSEWLRGVVRAMARPNGFCGPQQGERVKRCVEELRRRGSRETPWTQRLVPLPCECGKPGIYVVGRVTYCADHRPDAVHARERGTKYRDLGSAWIEQDIRRVGVTARDHETLRQCKQRNRR